MKVLPMIASAALTAVTTFAAIPSHAAPSADGQVAKIMMTANEGEVDTAKAVQSRLKNANVKTFAAQMIDEHKANDQELKDLAKQQKISLASSATTKELKDEVKKTEKDLKGQSDTDIDRAYIQSQVKMHQDLLNKIDTDLMPKVTNEALKTYLTDTKKHVQAHLDEAKNLQAQF